MKRFQAPILAVLLFTLSACTDTFEEPAFLGSQKDLSLVYKSLYMYSALHYEGVTTLDDGDFHVFVETTVSKFTGTTNHRIFYLPFAEFNTQLPATPYPGEGRLRLGNRLSYQHDAGTFTLDGGNYGKKTVITANFEEQHTLPEEWCINHSAAAEQNPNDYRIALNAAKSCFLAKRYEDSKHYTQRLKDNWPSFDRYTNEGGMLNDYHTLMGRHALREGRREEAAGHLLQSVNAGRPSAVMQSFGPNTILARELLLKGENAPVLAYLERVGQFWKSEPVEIWITRINQGRLPSLDIYNWDEELQGRDYEVNESTLAKDQVTGILNGNTLTGFYDYQGWDIRFNLFFGADGTASFGDRYLTVDAPWAVTDEGCIELDMRWNREHRCLYLERAGNHRLKLLPGVYDAETSLVVLEGRHEYAEPACVREFRDQDYESALTHCTADAHSGDKEAQNLLGVIYEFHLGERNDYQEAMRWYQLAADQGERFAPYNLAQLYRTGKAGVQDLAKAVEHYRKSAERGFGEAQFSLGVMYFEGAGTAMDMEQARYWWEKARDNDVVRAEEALGRIP